MSLTALFAVEFDTYLSILNLGLIYYGIMISFLIKALYDCFCFLSYIRMNRDKSLEGFKMKNFQVAGDLGRIDYLLLDKTGTLTTNSMQWSKNSTIENDFNMKN